MSLAGLLALLRSDAGIEAALTAAAQRRPSLALAAAAGVRPFLLATLTAERPVLLITATSRDAEDAATDLRVLLPPESVLDFPAWETLPHERLSPRSDTVGVRLAALRRLAHPEDDPGLSPIRVVVAPVRSLLQPLLRGLGDVLPVRLSPGADMELDALIERLVEIGYVRADMVGRRGEFAVRGGIVDVFAPTDEHPVRIEFFGDTVEEIRSFRVSDQRSLQAQSRFTAPPCRELLLTDEVRDRAAQLAEAVPAMSEVFAPIADGVAVEGMESLGPVLNPGGAETLADVMPADTLVLLQDPERIRRRSADLVATSAEFLTASWAAAAVGAAAPLDLGSTVYRDLDELRQHVLATGRGWWVTGTIGAGLDLAPADEESSEGSIRIDVQPAQEYRGDTDKALSEIGDQLRAGWRVVLLTPGHGPAQRLVERLAEVEVPARLDPDLADPPTGSVVHVTTAALEHGLRAPAQKLLVLSEADLVGQRSSTKDMRRLPSRRRAIDPLQLTAGDPVVHEQHGVGRYVEMLQREVGGATREYLVIEYAPARRGAPPDRLFVPTDQLDQVTRYVGGEAPTLHRLGGADWAKAKGRARKAVRDIAAHLIQLYSARQAAPGFAFGPDTPWQAELEDAFAYVETPDQSSAIDEVKEDMRKSVPMDRLICGDVGYGKTEIAVRAAFKAVQDGKQVAVLVPTTLLVQQHSSTFAERYANFPVRIARLSRFESEKETRAVLAGLADGSIDVVIGTHRLLGDKVRFKDLGLVIVDEEQRFGVEHKEALKRMRTHVDVLAMSATPIPRTLEMAVTGIREMSVIATPPEERHPVLTFVGPFDDRQIAAAIRRELLRDGQVFYVHNRVESIDKAAARLADLVPEARIRVAHGQMSEAALEQVILDFWERQFDVLVSTTIVESGLDIANANTLIVERADAMGLSQLHQLRGRVGRGRERAYAYFLYPPERPLTETAHDRLATIAQHNELGAGMHVAMKDLEIRGAGNLLGAEQSGHIADVGFDLYVRLVGEAVEAFRRGAGEELPEDVPDVRVELPINAHLPHEYVPHERLRLEAYRRLSEAVSGADIDEVAAEWRDRYGPPPPPAAALLDVARFRVAARAAGLTDVTAQGTMVKLAPVDLPESGQLRLRRLYPGAVVKASLRTILVPQPKTAPLGGRPLRNAELLEWASTLIQDLAPIGGGGRA